jgi:uncharacterized membrane protein HdeD (DUF308 family)
MLASCFEKGQTIMRMFLSTERWQRQAWWLILLEGIAALVIGILLLFSPGMTLLVIVQILGFFWLVTGILALVNLFSNHSQWGWKLAGGILGILAGIIVIRHPLWSTVLVPTVLVVILGIEGLIIGCTELVQAFGGGGAGRAVLGILNIVIGLILLFNPLIAAFVLPFVIGIFAIIGGIIAIVSAFRVRGEDVAPPQASTPLPT